MYLCQEDAHKVRSGTFAIFGAPANFLSSSMLAIAIGGGLVASPRLQGAAVAPHALLNQAVTKEGRGLVGEAAAESESSSAQLRKDAGNRPNILLVLTDDHGFTDLGGEIDSNIATPWLGELRRNGANLANGYATAPQCSPSRAGLLSGRNQNSFGIWRNGADAGYGPSTLPPHVMTIAEHMRGLGYLTGMAGKWHLGKLADPEKDPGARGFDWYFAGEINQFYGNFRRDEVGPFSGRIPLEHTIDKRNRIDVTADMAEKFVDRHTDVPWFFFWAPYGPHHPMLEDDDPHLQNFSITPYPFYTAAENEARRKGLAMVKLIDMRFGKLVQRLRYHHLEESTLIIFSSDNGAPLGLHYDKDNALDGFRREARQAPRPSPAVMPRGELFGDEHEREALRFVRDVDDSYVGSENVPHHVESAASVVPKLATRLGSKASGLGCSTNLEEVAAHGAAVSLCQGHSCCPLQHPGAAARRQGRHVGGRGQGADVRVLEGQDRAAGGPAC